MEKPITTDVSEARKLWDMSANLYPEGAFIINHTANYRPQTRIARQIVASNQIGNIRHISASMNGPLMWLFNNASNHSWVSRTPWSKTEDLLAEDQADRRAPMTGNGYAYGQIAHILAWIYAVLGAGDRTATEDIAAPKKVYCNMSHAPNTGADISFAAVITCHDGVTFSIGGTALLPGSQYADPPVGKHISIELFGDKGSLHYCGDDQKPETGKLELRKEDGQSEFPCSDHPQDGFYFEDGEEKGSGPDSMKAWLDACCLSSSQYSRGKDVDIRQIPPVNDALIGLRTVQVIDCMYRSSKSGNVEEIAHESPK